MTHAITINLPDTLYRQLKQAATLAREPVDTLVAQSLSHSLPPVLEDIPETYQADVYPLLAMSDAELERESRGIFPAGLWEEYQNLLAKRKEGKLDAGEQKRFEALRREADIFTFRKSYAAVLLKRRGYKLPTLTELEQTA